MYTDWVNRGGSSFTFITLITTCVEELRTGLPRSEAVMLKTYCCIVSKSKLDVSVISPEVALIANGASVESREYSTSPCEPWSLSVARTVSIGVPTIAVSITVEE